MNFMNLIDLILICKQCKFTQKLEDNTSYAKNVYFIIVVAIGENTLWRYQRVDIYSVYGSCDS
jgi:hypothetical protein